jgi:hypothetical protein
MRDTTKAALALLGAGVVTAAARIAWRSDWLRGPGSGALTDLLGCLMAGGALFGVLAIRSLAAGADRGRVLDDGLAALAACAWLVASLPPRAENYGAAGGADDFVSAYAPASLAAVVLLLGTGARWPAVGVRGLVLRHALVLALVTPLTGALVYASTREAAGELARSLTAAAAWGVVGLGAWLARPSRG